MLLITIDEAARQIGVSRKQVTEWVSRDKDPLPSVQVGVSGRVRKVVSSELESWFIAEAGRVSSVK